MPHAHMPLAPTPRLTLIITTAHMHIVLTKYRKGVPPCLLYKVPRRQIALDFSRLIGLNSDIHTGTTQKTDNGLLFLML